MSGLVPREARVDEVRPLPIAEGRKLFDDHNARPRGLGGTKKSTQKRYRAILDKFVAFTSAKQINDWHGVTKSVLTAYASHLTEKGYARKTIHSEMTLLKAAVKWL